jgi:ABC-2 type transport system ATP-binding protein
MTAMAAFDHVLSLKAVTKVFVSGRSETPALREVSLLIREAAVTALIGPDGAGKTTTIRLLCGALRSDAGEMSIGGFDIHRQTDQARALIGYLPQRFSLYEDLTVLENIRFFAEMRGLRPNEWRPRCMEILVFVGLDDFPARRAGFLSGGMKQKLGLAAALVHQPRVLLLDEPTTGVDPVTRQDFWQLIIRLTVQEEIAVLVSTPYMDEASRCKRVGFIRRGKLLIEGPPEELRHQLDDRILELRGKPLPGMRVVAKADEDVDDAQMFGDRLHLRVREGSAAAVIARLQSNLTANGAEIQSLRVVAPQLEDLFIAMLENEQ